MSNPCGGSGGGNRRHFLKAAAVTGAAAAALSPEALLAADAFPTITLGKTGTKVTRLGMGTSWTVQPSFVQTAIAAGVTYIDTAEGYEKGNSEKTIGEVLERTKKRKEVFLVTKNSSYRNAKGERALEVFEGPLNKSLERLRTDYTDAYYIHGISGEQIPMLFDKGVKAAFEAMKKSGKIKFAGLSCHDKGLVQVVEAAAECGWLDQIMIQFNYRTMDIDSVKRAVDMASKAKLGLVAMKTQGGAGSFQEKSDSPRFKEFVQKGFKKEQAAIKSVFADERFHVVVSEMTNRDMLRDNMAATREPLDKKAALLLEEHKQKTAHLYCHGCGHLCETAAKGVPVATVLRYLRYYSVYGKRAEARALYQALPAEARDLAAADLAAAEKACPHGLPVVELIGRADRYMS
ncbi:MAG: putative oxidoreductase of aldo/keto reductase family [Planctomycetota bacterium]|nr:putative oxidoreductase of aldo/keto reductase family [Planctomycetota bacterium]